MKFFLPRLVLSPRIAQRQLHLLRKHPPLISKSISGKIALEKRARKDLSLSETSAGWPAPSEQIEAARIFLTEAAASPANILLVPGRDSDGISSGTIVSLTLQLLGKQPEQIHTQFVPTGRNIFAESELISSIWREKKISHMIVLDQGSRASPPLVDKDTKVLITDHHHSVSFPEDATVVNACNHRPITTSSLLTYLICSPLHAEVSSRTSWVALLGIFGELGSQAPLGPPYPPELQQAKLEYGMTHLANLVSALNAPRRTPESNTVDAWNLLQHTPAMYPPPTPKRIMDGLVDKELLGKLLEAKGKIKEELERCKRVRPIFSTDGKVAVVYMESAYQIHPLIATRWSSFLRAKKLNFVMAANGGYVDGKVNFSCRVVKEKRVPKGDEGGVDIIAALKQYAAMNSWLQENIGEDFANGHKQAMGGSLRKDVWKVFIESCLALQMPLTREEHKAKKEKREKVKAEGAHMQSNTPDSWVQKPLE